MLLLFVLILACSPQNAIGKTVKWRLTNSECLRAFYVDYVPSDVRLLMIMLKGEARTGGRFTTLLTRYVDAIFAIIRKGSGLPLLNHPNSTLPKTICFTVEVERNGRLPFLDVLLLRSRDSQQSVQEAGQHEQTRQVAVTSPKKGQHQTDHRRGGRSASPMQSTVSSSRVGLKRVKLGIPKGPTFRMLMQSERKKYPNDRNPERAEMQKIKVQVRVESPEEDKENQGTSKLFSRGAKEAMDVECVARISQLRDEWGQFVTRSIRPRFPSLRDLSDWISERREAADVITDESDDPPCGVQRTLHDKKRRPRMVAAATLPDASALACPLCGGAHLLPSCPMFIRMRMERRAEVVRIKECVLVRLRNLYEKQLLDTSVGAHCALRVWPKT
ncbi:hypothetical protein M513_09594 [Trichuris suis]|uniref:Uncharacterized protein n=1 Tax=Trichuris suis TaxID=68888 RepID=A0A085LX73_9BILA|nr:hypothetical protein M513_09594 [Trichuris suis]